MRKKNRSEALKAADIIEAIGKVTKEKSISMDLVLDTLKDALTSGARRLLNPPINVEAEIDREKGTIEVYTRQTVVELVYDPEMQISLEEAKKIDPELEIGDELIQDLDIELFGRNAIQTAKQVIIQRVREAERSKIFDDFSDRIGELVTGTVQQIDRGNILINLGRTEALLPYREQIRKERYRQGDNIRGCIAEVKNNMKGPQVIISRTSPDFLARLFELEVPEIYDGTVRIVRVVRDPGHRAKIAVTTSDSRVDPVGACVGMRGNRVQAIVRELSNERIDIINYTDEASLLVRRVFAPAEVKRVYEVGDNKLVVIISEPDLAQAIGREGQNIRLAAKMIQKEIDIYGDEEFANFSEEEREKVLAEEEEPVQEIEDEIPVILADESEGPVADEELNENAEMAANEGDTEDEVDAVIEGTEEYDSIEDASDSESETEEDDDSPVQSLVEDAVTDTDDDEVPTDEKITNPELPEE